MSSLRALYSLIVVAIITCVYQFVLHRTRGFKIKATDIAEPEWCTHDLCQQCQSLGLGLPYLDDRFVRYRIYILKGSTCPFCLYLYSTLFCDGAEAFPKVATKSVCVVIDSAPAPWDNSQRHLVFADEMQLGALARFVLYPTIEYENPRPTVSYRVINKHMIDFAILNTWIGYCRDHHSETCSYQDILGGQPIPDNHGFKVINCITRKIVKAKIMTTSYVALSYVWGKQSTQEVDSGPDSLPARLPNTIEDAIKLTIQLGFQYLWVDKYCINQSDHEDLRSQVLMMDVIYHAASVTVIAAAGADSTFGLPGVSCPRVLLKGIRLDGTTWTATKADRKYPIRQSVWFGRGWTYQESFFSRRRLIFTQEQVIFECNCMSCFETLRTGFDKSLPTHEPILGNVQNIQLMSNTWPYSRYIEAYTRRTLSNQADTLKAIRGLLRSFTTKEEPWQQYWGILITPSAYWSHLPKKRCGDLDPISPEQVAISLSCGLCWHVNLDTTPTRRIVRREGFPSWSWSGWLAAVTFTGDERPEKRDSHYSAPREYYLQKTDGSRMLLTEDLAARIFLDERFASCFTHNLCFEAQVLNLRVTYIEDGIQYLDSHHQRPKEELKSNFAVKIIAGQDDRPQGDLDPRTYYWPLLVTPHVEEGGEIHQSLCNQIVQCVVLSRLWGLVVRERDGILERIGLVRLTQEGMHMHPAEEERLHLRDYFPSSIREVVLG